MSRKSYDNWEYGLVRTTFYPGKARVDYHGVPDNPFAVQSVQDAITSSTNSFEWDANGNMVHSVCNAPYYERHLCWTEDNRLQGYSEYSEEQGDISAWYNYAASGDRNFKITSPKLNLRQNAEGLRYSAYLKYPTLYASALITFNKGGYTKHYFEGSNRICSRIGGGFSAVNWSSIENRVPELDGDYESLFNKQNESVNHTFDKCLGIGIEADDIIDLYDVVKNEHERDEQEPAFFYHSDHLGSAAYLTNDAGQVTQTLNYLPYGEDWVDVQNYVETQYPRLGIYTFNGKEKDYESGFHYYGARYYWSEVLTGWLSVDPLMDKYPSVSPYNYCILNPVKMIDPNGEDSWEVDENGNVSHLNNKGGENHQIVRYKKTNIERNYYNKEYYRIFNDLMNNSSTYGESEYQEAMANIYLSMANNTNVEWMLQRYNDDTYGLGTVHNSDWSPTPSEITSVYLGESCAKTYKDVITMVHSHPSHDLSSESRRMGYKGINFRGNLEFDGDASMKLKYPWINSYVYFPETRNLWYIKEYNPLWIKKIENFRQLFFGTYNTK